MVVFNSIRLGPSFRKFDGMEGRHTLAAKHRCSALLSTYAPSNHERKSTMLEMVSPFFRPLNSDVQMNMVSSANCRAAR